METILDLLKENAKEQLEKEKEQRALKIAYVEKQIVPWLLGHLQMRNTGLQVFTAIQGALMVAFSTSHAFGVLALGLASTIAFILWDTRNRDVFKRLHSLAEELVDREVFGVGADGQAKDGLHRQALGTLTTSGVMNPQLSLSSGFASHTWAIRIVVIASMLCWLSFAMQNFLP